MEWSAPLACTRYDVSSTSGRPSNVPVIAYTEETAYYHARLWAHLQQAGSMIGYYDIIVAATALERSSAVATFNVRHFRSIPGLTVIHPV